MKIAFASLFPLFILEAMKPAIVALVLLVVFLSGCSNNYSNSNLEQENKLLMAGVQAKFELENVINNLGRCKNITGQSEKENCFLDVIVESQRPAFCLMAPQGSDEVQFRTRCVGMIAAKQGNLGLCDSLDSAEEAAKCRTMDTNPANSAGAQGKADPYEEASESLSNAAKELTVKIAEEDLPQYFILDPIGKYTPVRYSDGIINGFREGQYGSLFVYGKPVAFKNLTITYKSPEGNYVNGSILVFNDIKTTDLYAKYSFEQDSVAKTILERFGGGAIAYKPFPAAPEIYFAWKSGNKFISFYVSEKLFDKEGTENIVIQEYLEKHPPK